MVASEDTEASAVGGQMGGKTYLGAEVGDAGHRDAAASLYEKTFFTAGSQGRKSSMQVCHLSLEYPPNIYGGVGVHVARLTEALQIANVQVQVRTLAGGGSKSVGGVSEAPAGVEVTRHLRGDSRYSETEGVHS